MLGVDAQTVNELVEGLDDQPTTSQLQFVKDSAATLVGKLKEAANFEEDSSDQYVIQAVENWLTDAENFLNAADWEGVEECINSSPSDVGEMLNDDAQEAGYDTPLEHLQNEYPEPSAFVTHFVKNICLYNAGYEFSTLEYFASSEDDNKSEEGVNEAALAFFRQAGKSGD